MLAQYVSLAIGFAMFTKRVTNTIAAMAFTNLLHFEMKISIAPNSLEGRAQRRHPSLSNSKEESREISMVVTLISPSSIDVRWSLSANFNIVHLFGDILDFWKLIYLSCKAVFIWYAWWRISIAMFTKRETNTIAAGTFANYLRQRGLCFNRVTYLQRNEQIFMKLLPEVVLG